MTSLEKRELVLLDRLLACEEAQREGEIVNLADGDEALAGRLRELLHLDRQLGAIGDSLGEGVCLNGVQGLYRLLRVVGRGATSEVCSAASSLPEADEIVAVKLIDASVGSHAIRRVERLAEASDRARPAGVVPLLDAGTSPDGRPFVVMPLVRGQPITDYCNSRFLGIDGRLEVLLQLCRVVESLHRAGMIHADLKPANILVDADGVVHVLDVSGPVVGDSERDGPIPFTRAYAAPEQIDGQGPTERSDVYALGMIAGEVILGRSSHDTAIDGAAERVIRYSDDSTQTVRLSTDALASERGLTRRQFESLGRGELNRLLAIATSHDPAQRPQTPAGLASALEVVARSPAIRRLSTGAEHDVRRRLRRRTMVAAAVGGLVVGASVFVGLAAVVDQERRAMAELDDEVHVALARALRHIGDDPASVESAAVLLASIADRRAIDPGLTELERAMARTVASKAWDEVSAEEVRDAAEALSYSPDTAGDIEHAVPLASLACTAVVSGTAEDALLLARSVLTSVGTSREEEHVTARILALLAVLKIGEGSEASFLLDALAPELVGGETLHGLLRIEIAMAMGEQTRAEGDLDDLVESSVHSRDRAAVRDDLGRFIQHMEWSGYTSAGIDWLGVAGRFESATN